MALLLSSLVSCFSVFACDYPVALHHEAPGEQGPCERCYLCNLHFQAMVGAKCLLHE